MPIISEYTTLLSQALSLSQRALEYDSNDLANTQTPKFVQQTLSFQSALQQAWTQQSPALATIQGTVVSEPGAVSPDGSSNDMTAIMVNLTQNQLTYDLAAQTLQTQETNLQTIANTTTP